MLCTGSGCQTIGIGDFKKTLMEEIARRHLSEEVALMDAGCSGFCGVAPVMVVQPEGVFYQKLQVKDIPRLVEEHFLKGRVVKQLLYREPESEETIPNMNDIPFFSH